jgi:hypothetical protein
VGHVERMGKMRNSYKVSVGTLGPLGRTRRWEGVDGINLAQVRPSGVNTIMNLQVP